MKILKTILCVLLSSMFLLFAGACNSYDNGPPQRYEDTTSSAFVNFYIRADKTTGYGEKAFVEIRYNIEVKKEFSLSSRYAKQVTDLIFVVALNDKHDTDYYKQKFLTVDGIERENILNGATLPTTGGGMIVDFKCEVGDTYGKTFYMQRYHVENKLATAIASVGKYRLYLAILGLSTEASEIQEEAIKNEFYLIPTDIVLNMQ